MKLLFKDGSSIDAPQDKEAAGRFLADIMTNNGKVPGQDQRISWGTFVDTITNKDLVKTSEIQALLPIATEIIMREPIEPILVINSLFERIVSKGLQTQVLAGAIGAVYAGDVQEGGQYPEVMFQIGGAVQTAWVGKSGIAAAFTAESLRYSTWDLMGTNLRLMKAAMDRHKEQKAARFLKSLGTVLFDNRNPTQSLYGVTTGRGADMAPNATMNADDLMVAYAHSQQEGYVYNLMLVHPLMYWKFLMDPVMRTIMLAGGGGSWYNMYQGNPGPLASWSNGAMGGMGPSMGNRVVPANSPSGETPTEAPHNATSTFSLPSYFPGSFTVIPSPYVPFDIHERVGDIILLSQGNVGYHLVDEEMTTTEWKEEAVDVTKVKMTERYGYAIKHEGQGVGVIKNVKCDRNYWDGVIQVQASLSDAAPIDPATPLL